jgi:hypothetical protein
MPGKFPAVRCVSFRFSLAVLCGLCAPMLAQRSVQHLPLDGAWQFRQTATEPIAADRVGTHAGTTDSREAYTGLRSVRMLREPDEWGRSLAFVVNGIPIFAKGQTLREHQGRSSKSVSSRPKHSGVEGPAVR